MKIVFVKTRHEYAPYVDFWELVRLSKYETCTINDINLSGDVLYIVTPINGELAPKINLERDRLRDVKPSAKVVAWQLERPDEGMASGPGVLEVQNNELLKWVDEVWVSDRHYASLDSRYVHVPLGSHTGLRIGSPSQKIYDLCHLSARFSRRNLILDPILGYKRRFVTAIGGKTVLPKQRPLKQQGRRRTVIVLGRRRKEPPKARVAKLQPKILTHPQERLSLTKAWSIGPNGWGESRARTLNSSRAMINVHKTPAPIGEPIRFALAAAYRLPLITEILADPWPMVSGVHFLEADQYGLRGKTEEALSLPNLQEFGDRLHNLLCVEMPFEKGVNEIAEKRFRGK